MKIALSTKSAHQRAHADALRAGLDALGVHDLGADVVVCWGWRAGLRHRRQGKDVLVLERGYLGDRFSYTSIAWNGLNGNAAFPEYSDDGGERFRACGFELRPLRSDGDYVLIIGQVATDMAVRDVNIREWEKAAATRARQAMGLPVVYRPHPQDVKRRRERRVHGTETNRGSLAEALAGAALVVTYSSNTAVDALVAGVPAVAESEGSMAYGVAATEIGGRVDWDARERWAHALAWKQWTVEEIASGYALEGILNG